MNRLWATAVPARLTKMGQIEPRLCRNEGVALLLVQLNCLGDRSAGFSAEWERGVD